MKKSKVNSWMFFLSILSLVLIIGLTIGSFYIYSSNKAIIRTTKSLENDLEKTKNDYGKKYKQVNEEIIELSKASKKQNVKYVFSYDELLKEAREKTTEFFKVYHNWNSLTSYQSRPSKLEGIASDDLLNDKNIFDSGLDSTGGDMIKALDLKSEFENATVTIAGMEEDVKLLVLVDIKSSEGDSYSEKELAYEVTYSQSNKLITAIKKLTALEGDNS